MDTTSDPITSLRDIPLFSTLSDEEMHRITRHVRLKKFQKDQVILFEKDANEFMYVILSGKVKVVQTTENGKEILLAIHQAQESFGEISLIDGKTNPATVVALEKTRIALVSRKDFYAILYSQKKVMDNLLRLLASRLRENWKTIYLLNFKDSSRRISMLLLMLSYNAGETTREGVELRLRLTHQDIAGMAGLTRESVTRVLDRWKTEGIITVLKNRHIRLNPEFFSKKPIA